MKPDQPGKDVKVAVLDEAVKVIVAERGTQGDGKKTYGANSLIVGELFYKDAEVDSKGGDHEAEEKEEVAEVIKDVQKHLHQKAQARKDSQEKANFDESEEDDAGLQRLDCILLSRCHKT